MAESNRPHFIIPQKKLIKESTNPTGRSFLYKRDDYSEHGKSLINKVRESKQELSKTVDSGLTDNIFLEIKTPSNISVKNEKKRFKDLGLEMVSYSDRAKNIGIAKTTNKQLEELEAKLEKYSSTDENIGKSNLSIIENIAPVSVEDKLSSDILSRTGEEPLKTIIFLYKELTSLEKDAILLKIKDYISEKDGEFLDSYSYSTGESTAVVNASLKTLKDLGQNFTTLRQITVDRLFFVTDSTPIAPLPNNININPPNSNIIVAVFDSGIQKNCNLLSNLIVDSSSFLPDGSISPHFEHGTFVASRITYGDDLEIDLQNHSITPACKLFDVAVIGKNSAGGQIGLDEQALAKAIDIATNNFPPDVRVANISLGTNEPILDDKYSLVATTIDQLSRTKDILFVTTAGNIRDPRRVSTYPNEILNPNWRIDLPGESLLALTVGSIARYTDQEAISRETELSPFSRIGPGSDGGIKPELVAHGGNCRKNGLPISRIATQGIYGNGTQIAWDIGTSFAAPLVSGMAAQLFGIYGASSSNLVKALLCHFTTPALTPPNVDNPTMCVGFGIPNLEMSKSAGQYNAAFLCESKIDTKNYLYIPFFVPQALGTTNRNSKLRIRGTIVFDPPVQSSNYKEYSCARISASIIKPNNGHYMQVNLTSESILSRLAWNPIIKFDKIFSRSYSPGEWRIKLRLWTRGNFEIFEQRFAVIVELIDEYSTVDIWTDIANETSGEYMVSTPRVA